MALNPLAGLAAGMMGALLMLAVMFFLGPLRHISPGLLMGQIGLSLAPSLAKTYSAIGIGCCIHLLVGGVTGLLYALCQDQIPRAALIVVGFFYGFMLWVLGSFLAGLLFGDALRSSLRSWPWLVAHLLFGVWLATTASWSQNRRQLGAHRTVPLD